MVYGPENVVSGRLEEKGPFGDKYTSTSNRAELRAAIAAVRLCDWRADGVENIIMATESSYVFDGATNWAEGWIRKDWKTLSGPYTTAHPPQGSVCPLFRQAPPTYKRTVLGLLR